MEKELKFIVEGTSENDSFGVHSNIAETVTKIIKKMDLSKQSFNLGIFGDWGTGKSFIVNKIKNKIMNDEDIIFVSIDVWKFIGMPLMRSILIEIDKSFRSLADEKVILKKYSEDFDDKWLQRKLYYDEYFEDKVKLNNKEVIDKLKDIGKIYKNIFIGFGGLLVILILLLAFKKVELNLWANILTSLITSTTIFILATLSIKEKLLKPIEDISEVILFKRETRDYRANPDFSSEQFEATFKEITEFLCSDNKNRKLVLVFDNIDRCEPKLSYEMMSTIKTYMELKNCFYIIPCDDEALLKYLSKEVQNTENNTQSFEREYSREFIDKFFQTYFRVPQLKEVDRDKFIKEQLSLVNITEVTENEIEKISNILYYAYKGLTPRQIKRFINDFAIYYYIAEDCDKEKTILLKNIVFFTIMICIKQRWAKFEYELIENPGYFSDFVRNSSEYKEKINEFNGLFNFLDNIKNWLILDCSVMPFIYFKESNNENDVIEKLRNADLLNLTVENIKTIIKYINKNDISPIYLFNAVKSIIKSISQLDRFKEQALINSYWVSINKLENKNEYFNFIAEDEKICNAFFLTFSQYDGILKNKNKEIIYQYVQSADNDNNAMKILDSIIKYDKKLESKYIDKWFDDLLSKKNRIRIIIEKIIEKNKSECISNNVKNDICNKMFDEQNQPDIDLVDISIKIGFNKLHKEERSIVAKNLLKYLEVYLSDITSHEASFRRSYGENSPTYINSLKSWMQNIKLNVEITTKIMQILSINDFSDKNKAKKYLGDLVRLSKYCDNDFFLKYLTKAIYFIDIDIDNNNILLEVLNAFKINEIHKKILINDNINYIKEALKNEKFKNAMLENEVYLSEIYAAIDYESFDVEKDFYLFQKDKIDIKNLIEFYKNLMKSNKGIEKNKKAIDNLIYEKAIVEMKENKNGDLMLFLVEQNFQFITKDQEIIEKRNIFIDFFKDNSEIGIKIFIKFKEEFKSAFIEMFLIPIMKYLNSEISSTEDISKYCSIDNLIESPINNAELKNLIEKITNELLTEGQSYQERLFGVRLLKKINHNFSKKNKENMKKIFTEDEIKENNELKFLTLEE